jgi:hypothetical protein
VTALILVGAAVAGCSSSKRELVGFTPPDQTSTTSSTIRAATTTAPSTTVATGSSSTATGATVAASAQWTTATANLAGLPSECGNLSLVSARTDRDVVIASVAQQGMWSSPADAGSWVHLGQGAGSATVTNRGSTIVYDPDHPDTFWESGLYNGNGVYRTDDNGATFRQLGDVPGADSVSVDLTDPNRRTLLASIHERTTAFRSTDGGATWTDVSTTLPKTAGNTRSAYVINAQTFLLATTGTPQGGLFRTSDAGATWTQVFQGDMGAGPLVTKGDGAMYWTANSGGIAKSIDAGVTWSPVARASTVTPSAGPLIELPGGLIAGVGKQAVIVSPDQGVTWRTVGPVMPFPPIGLTYSPARKAFYIWYFTCARNADNPVPADAIMTLAYDATAS